MTTTKQARSSIQIADYEHAGDLDHATQDLEAAGIKWLDKGEIVDADGDLIGFVTVDRADAERAHDLIG